MPGSTTDHPPVGSPAATHGRRRICVVGSGPRFLSGISYYTNRLVNALGERHDVSAILMRQLLPTRLYPGRERVGTELVRFTQPRETPVFDGVDWWWGKSILRALGLLRAERPDVVVLEWWTGTVLHTYLLLALVARALEARVVMEFHEVLDVGELGIAPARWYVNAVAPLLVRLSSGYVVHNEFDRASLEETYGLGGKPVALIPHGPYDRYARGDAALVEPEDDVCRLLYFGVIRPFKGVEDIVAAFDQLSEEEVQRFRLTVVGESWEGWTLPNERIAASRHRDRIEFVNRYVADEEVGALFDRADAVVLAYHRSSASGPLHLAMARGLPVVVTQVGGLVEAAADYEGAIRVAPRDPAAIRAAFDRAYAWRRRRFDDVHSWERTLAGYDELFDRVGAGRRVA